MFLLELLRDWQLARRGMPDIAYVDNTWDRSPGAPRVLAIRRGEPGLHPVDTSLSAAALNQASGVAWEQAAPLIGREVPRERAPAARSGR